MANVLSGSEDGVVLAPALAMLIPLPIVEGSAGIGLTGTTYVRATQKISVFGTISGSNGITWYWNGVDSTGTKVGRWRLVDDAGNVIMSDVRSGPGNWAGERVYSTATASNLPSGGHEIWLEVSFDGATTGLINFLSTPMWSVY